MYDQQLKKIAQKILSPSKQSKANSPPSRKENQGTQTLEVSRTADFSSFVDLDNEEEGDFGICEVDARARVGESRVSERLDTSRKVQSLQTPRGKKGGSIKKTPGRSEWASMKQRILSLTQQVKKLK
jgi:predicted RNA-binding protein with RPS1 domain